MNSDLSSLRKDLRICSMGHKLGHASKYFHKRVISLEDGFFKYFVNYPQKFEENNFAALNEFKPKAGVLINNCIIEYPSQQEKVKLKKDHCLIIKFPTNDLLIWEKVASENSKSKYCAFNKDRQPIVASTTVDGTGTHEMNIKKGIEEKCIKWTFGFDTQEELLKWMSLMEKHRNPLGFKKPQGEQTMLAASEVNNFEMGIDPNLKVEPLKNIYEAGFDKDDEDAVNKPNEIFREEIDKARIKNKDCVNKKKLEEKSKQEKRLEDKKREEEEQKQLEKQKEAQKSR